MEISIIIFLWILELFVAIRWHIWFCTWRSSFLVGCLDGKRMSNKAHSMPDLCGVTTSIVGEVAACKGILVQPVIWMAFGDGSSDGTMVSLTAATGSRCFGYVLPASKGW